MYVNSAKSTLRRHDIKSSPEKKSKCLKLTKSYLEKCRNNLIYITTINCTFSAF